MEREKLRNWTRASGAFLGMLLIINGIGGIRGDLEGWLGISRWLGKVLPGPLLLLLGVLFVFGPWLLFRNREAPTVPTATQQVAKPQTAPGPTSSASLSQPPSNVQVLQGKVDLASRADSRIPVYYSQAFASKPQLEVTMDSSLGNKIMTTDETPEGFVLVRPSFWVGGTSDIVIWKATGRSA